MLITLYHIIYILYFMYVDHAILCDILAGVSCVPIVQSTSGDQFGGIFWNIKNIIIIKYFIFVSQGGSL